MGDFLTVISSLALPGGLALIALLFILGAKVIIDVQKGKIVSQEKKFKSELDKDNAAYRGLSETQKVKIILAKLKEPPPPENWTPADYITYKERERASWDKKFYAALLTGIIAFVVAIIGAVLILSGGSSSRSAEQPTVVAAASTPTTIATVAATPTTVIPATATPNPTATPQPPTNTPLPPPTNTPSPTPTITPTPQPTNTPAPTNTPVPPTATPPPTPDPILENLSDGTFKNKWRQDGNWGISNGQIYKLLTGTKGLTVAQPTDCWTDYIVDVSLSTIPRNYINFGDTNSTITGRVWVRVREKDDNNYIAARISATGMAIELVKNGITSIVGDDGYKRPGNSESPNMNLRIVVKGQSFTILEDSNQIASFSPVDMPSCGTIAFRTEKYTNEGTLAGFSNIKITHL